jgi:surface polysaccharide O-acyltransferase-like enzyme
VKSVPRTVFTFGLCVTLAISEPVDNKAGNGLSIPVDLIRTFGIILVVLLHASNEYYTTIMQTSLESPVYWWSSTIYKSFALPCVPLFVILSGALLLQPSKTNEPIRVFLKKRFNRIGLAFMFWSAIYLVWAFLVSQTPVTFDNIVEGTLYSLFSGSYYHFWFLYLIAGLYLLTPILRKIVSVKDPKILKYLILLWFVDVAVVPLIQMITGYSLNDTVFVVGGFIGYFVLGIYLQRVKVSSSILRLLFFLSFIFTIVSTWIMHFHFEHIGQNYFFFGYLSVNVILASVTMFMLLSKLPVNWSRNIHPLVNRVVHAIGKNTLPIYMFHLIVMETLQRGYLGFKLSLTVMNPVIGIPVMTVVTLLITFGLILFMKKVPVLRTLIG